MENAETFEITERQDLVRELLRSRPKIALVGYTETRNEAPWDDPEWLIVGCNNLHNFVDDSKTHLWFDMHSVAEVRTDEQHVGWLRNASIPVVVIDEQPDWPTSVRYPIEGIEAALPSYWTNTISYEIALVLAWARDTCTELGLWGIDLAQDTEYAKQRPSCEMYLGIAMGMGLKVQIPQTSDLLKAGFRYGYEDEGPMFKRFQARANELRQRRGELLSQRTQCEAAINQIDGALQQIEYTLGVWVSAQTGGDRTGKVNADGARLMAPVTQILEQADVAEAAARAAQSDGASKQEVSVG